MNNNITSTELILIISKLLQQYDYLFSYDYSIFDDTDMYNLAVLCIRWSIRLNLICDQIIAHYPMAVNPSSSINDFHEFMDQLNNNVAIYLDNNDAIAEQFIS